MNEHLKSLLNEEQDPKAIKKISARLQDLLMKDETVGYIGVQKRPAVNVFPDSIVLTDRRIIICRPKNLGLSMDFTDYAWEDISATLVKEGLLGSEFSFSTKTGMQVSIDYLPKAQARRIYTFAKEQMEAAKQSPVAPHQPPGEEAEEPEVEEVTDFAEIVPVSFSGFRDEKQHPEEDPAEDHPAPPAESLSSESLFEKLQNYKKLLDNGLILQSEYDALKKEILSRM